MGPDQKRMRKCILKGTTLETPFHIAFISNEAQFTLHFFQGRISAMPEIRADLFLAISKIGMCLLTSLFFRTLYYFGSQLAMV